MAEGRSNAAIAARLTVTEKAVAKHINNVFAKLDLPLAPDDHRRVLAVLSYLDLRRRGGQSSPGLRTAMPSSRVRNLRSG